MSGRRGPVSTGYIWMTWNATLVNNWLDPLLREAGIDEYVALGALGGSPDILAWMLGSRHIAVEVEAHLDSLWRWKSERERGVS